MGSLRKLSGGSWSMIRLRLGPIPAIQSHSRAMSGYGKHIPFKATHMDELPVPQGSWEAHYNKKNKSYNRHLFFGLIYFAITLWVIVRTDVIFFNFFKPPLDDEEEDICETAPPPSSTKKC